MSIHPVCGKPGAGKSRFATGRISRTLRETRRNVVASVPLRIGRLNQLMQQRYPDEDLEVATRVRLLDDAEMKYFWKFRSVEDVGPPELYELHKGTVEKRLPSGAIEHVPISDERRSFLIKFLNTWAKVPVFSDKGAGVAYFLDEAHIAFNARQWANCADAALFYLSQHRKLGDEVWPITQAFGNLDKQFRSVAEDFTVLRNEYVAKYGIFKGRGRFTWKTYASEPSGNAEPFAHGDFEIDAEGLASCYDTAKGIGVHGSKADIGRRAKGIPIMWAIPMMIGVASLCGIIPWLMGKGAGSFLTSSTEKEMQAKAGNLAKPGKAAKAAASAPGADSGSGDSKQIGGPVFEVVAGVMMRGDSLYVGVEGRGWLAVVSPVGADGLMLSDGSMVRRRDVVSGGGVTAARKAAEMAAGNSVAVQSSGG